VTEFAIILLLILANGVFSGAEIALVTVRRALVEEQAERGSARARAVLQLLEDPERFLATVQVGISIVGASAAAFGGATLAGPLADYLRTFPPLAAQAHTLALGAVVAAVSFLSIVLGELVPKSLALRSAERFALFVAPPMRWLSLVARPIVWLLSSAANLVLRPLGDSTSFTEVRHSPAELLRMVGDAARAGTIHPDAGEIAVRALEMPELTVADVLVPRQEVVMIPLSATPEELQRLLLEESHSRYPVYRDSIDDIVGYVSVKDVFALVWERQLIVLADLLRPPLVVIEKTSVVELIREMREGRTQLAVVVDEYGGFAGIATLEDLLEELVGEIWSEHQEAPPDVIETRTPEGGVVLGSSTIRDVSRALDLELPDDGPYTTVAGLSIALAGRIPAIGEVLEGPGFRLTVLEATPRRVLRLRVVAVPRVVEES
jgi:putative hemolysin